MKSYSKRKIEPTTNIRITDIQIKVYNYNYNKSNRLLIPLITLIVLILIISHLKIIEVISNQRNTFQTL